MKQLNNIQNFSIYNTAIKDIAGLQEVSNLYRILGELKSDDFDDLEKIKNFLVDIRTEKTKQKIAWAIQKTILQFYDQNHLDLMSKIFSLGIESDDLRFAFFWHLSLTNRLFREISLGVFVKAYYSGRASISQNDIIPFVKEIKNESGNPLWAEETIYRIATKYLSLLTKLNFVSSGRTKEFKPIRPSSEAQILFIYFSKLFNPRSPDIMSHDFLPISFISPKDMQQKFKKLSLKGFFNMNFNGVALNIELTHSYKGICDALYN